MSRQVLPRGINSYPLEEVAELAIRDIILLVGVVALDICPILGVTLFELLALTLTTLQEFIDLYARMEGCLVC